MTGSFCNFKQQNIKMTQMSDVDNYVEIGDFFTNIRLQKYTHVIGRFATNPARR